MFRTVAKVRQSYGIVNESFTLSKLCFHSKRGSQILRTANSGKESACQCRRCKKWGFNPWIGKIPWRKKRHPTPVFLPGELHGQRSRVGYSPWSCKESDTLSKLKCSHYSCSIDLTVYGFTVGFVQCFLFSRFIKLNRI